MTSCMAFYCNQTLYFLFLLIENWLNTELKSRKNYEYLLDLID